MKTLRNLLWAGLALALISCDESSYEVHQTFFYPQQPGGMQLYADQPSDTIHVYSLDSWTASTTQEWMSVTPDAFTVSPTTSGDTRLTVSVTPNTTGALRTGYLVVNAHDAVSMAVNQFPWLNVIVPEPIYYTDAPEGGDAASTTRARFDLRLSPTTQDTIAVFRVYRDGATLQSDAKWLQPDRATFSAGRDTVRLSVAPNQTGAARSARLTLTSAGVATDITVTQPVAQ